jgi:hypothetical protein
MHRCDCRLQRQRHLRCHCHLCRRCVLPSPFIAPLLLSQSVCRVVSPSHPLARSMHESATVLATPRVLRRRPGHLPQAHQVVGVWHRATSRDVRQRSTAGGEARTYVRVVLSLSRPLPLSHSISLAGSSFSPLHLSLSLASLSLSLSPSLAPHTLLSLSASVSHDDTSACLHKCVFPSTGRRDSDARPAGVYPMDAAPPSVLDVVVVEALRARPLHTAHVTRLAFSHDGRQLARYVRASP